MKWPLFVISLFALWVAFDALYMLPGRYTAFNFELAAVGIGVGILTAWLSGRRFAEADSRRRKRGAIMQAPPVVACIVVLVVFSAIALLKITASR